MIVVDVNIIAYLWIPGEHTELVENLLRKDSSWHSPILWRSEFHSILSGYLRRGELDLKKAVQLAYEAQIFLKGNEYIVETDRVLAMVKKSKCSAYDCEYVALAEKLRVPLVTTDGQVLQAFPHIALRAGDFVAREKG